MKRITFVTLECPCGHKWQPRIPEPLECPKCQRPIARWPKAMQPGEGAQNGVG